MNWGQFGPTSLRLTTSTSSLAVVLHNITTLFNLPGKRLNFSLNITTTIEPSLITSWIQWDCQIFLWIFSPSHVQFISNYYLSRCSEMDTTLRGDLPSSVLILLQVLDLTLPPTLYLIYELTNMCPLITKSTKKVCVVYRIVKPWSSEYFVIQFTISWLTHTYRDIIISYNKNQLEWKYKSNENMHTSPLPIPKLVHSPLLHFRIIFIYFSWVFSPAFIWCPCIS